MVKRHKKRLRRDRSNRRGVNAVTVLPTRSDADLDPGSAAEALAGTGSSDQHANESLLHDPPTRNETLSGFVTEHVHPVAGSQPKDQAPADSEHDDVLLQRARMLRGSRMQATMPIEEANFGRAFGQWVMAVRCECGRRWFEVDAVYQAQCPRCGKIVYVECDDDTTPDV
jgi:hypothetical protein